MPFAMMIPGSDAPRGPYGIRMQNKFLYADLHANSVALGIEKMVPLHGCMHDTASNYLDTVLYACRTRVFGLDMRTYATRRIIILNITFFVENAFLMVKKAGIYGD